MTDLDLAELERLAKAATPGERTASGSLISAAGAVLEVVYFSDADPLTREEGTK